MKQKGRTPDGTAAEKKKKARPLKALARVLAVLLAAAAAAGAAVFAYAGYTKTHYAVTFYRETTGKLKGNVRLAVISDIHDREYGEGSSRLVSDIRGLAPDLILFLGDTVTRTNDSYEPMLGLVSALSKIAPCYGVLGNHESERIYYRGDRQLPERLEKAGLTLLRNAQATVAVGGDTVRLIGLEGTVYGFDEYGGRAFMDGVEFDPSVYCIVMNHVPILFEQKLSGYGFDLGIAGHVHGGIVEIPFVGGLYSEEEGWFPRYWAGEYALEGGKTLIVSRGMGDSRPVPRINNMPELVVIDIAGS